MVGSIRSTATRFCRTATRILGAACLALTVNAGAQTPYPERPIRVVVPWPAGAITDALARKLAEQVSPKLGQTLVIENRPGASGSIGAQYASKAAADGYTVLVASSDTHAINPHYYTKLSYSINDFVDVLGLARFSYAIAVGGHVRADTLADLVALAKKNPKQLSYSSWGNGSLAHLGSELFNAAAGIELLHVPFQGAAPALSALMAGTVDMMIVPVGMAEQNRHTGKIKILALAGPARYPVIADVPTTAELGYPTVIVQQWFGLAAPKGTPGLPIERLAAAFTTAVGQPDTAQWLATQGGEAFALDGPKFRAFVEGESARWRTVLRDADIPLQ